MCVRAEATLPSASPPRAVNGIAATNVHRGPAQVDANLSRTTCSPLNEKTLTLRCETITLCTTFSWRRSEKTTDRPTTRCFTSSDGCS